MSEQLEFSESDVSVSGNWLYVEGLPLRSTVLRHSKDKKVVSHEALQQILTVGRVAVLDGIVNFKPRGDTTPSIWTVHLGVNRQVEGRDGKLFTEKGYKNGGINESIDEIKEPFRPYWNAIKDRGFRPEVRRTWGKWDNGAWMLLRQPSLMQVSKEWLGYLENPELSQLRESLEGSSGDEFRTFSDTVRHSAIALVAKAQHEYVDAIDDALKMQVISSDERRAMRERQQVGAQLALVAFKQTIEYSSGQEEDIEDALTYARNSDFIDASSVLAIENATY